MIGASNIRQQARFWRAVERADMIKTDNEARLDDREREAAIIADIIKTRTADEWEVYFQARHVPAARVRTMAEALADRHFQERRVFHKFDRVAGIDGRLVKREVTAPGTEKVIIDGSLLWETHGGLSRCGVAYVTDLFTTDEYGARGERYQPLSFGSMHHVVHEREAIESEASGGH